MNRDTLILAVLLGMGIVAMTVLTVAGKPVPELFAYIMTALGGALTGASVPRKADRQAAGGRGGV